MKIKEVACPLGILLLKFSSLELLFLFANGDVQIGVTARF